ncbi:hypothetical protein LIPSTDRAFT_72941, partial [Lipomyces starkeyi NRRL Y-11557]
MTCSYAAYCDLCFPICFFISTVCCCALIVLGARYIYPVVNLLSNCEGYSHCSIMKTAI